MFVKTNHFFLTKLLEKATGYRDEVLSHMPDLDRLIFVIRFPYLKGLEYKHVYDLHVLYFLQLLFVAEPLFYL